jgi:hypothetical protein
MFWLAHLVLGVCDCCVLVEVVSKISFEPQGEGL